MKDAGFDAAVDFQPFNKQLDLFVDKKGMEYNKPANRVKGFIYLHLINRINKGWYNKFYTGRWSILDYEEYVDFVITQAPQQTINYFQVSRPCGTIQQEGRTGILYLKMLRRPPTKNGLHI